MLRFDGRVVVITGAGSGIGKCYAVEFGERGASVVVNDLGVSTRGEGSSSKVADIVVDEIRQKGGRAVPDYNSVEHGEKIIQTAIDNFGRVDILVNNAGILRDRSFARTSDLDWDLIQNVHLRGSFITTRAAWPHMVKQKYGKIIVTSSMAGILGNFGQSNYSAAKLGLVGLSNTLSREGERHGICSNVIVPMAGSRLTKGVLTPDMLDILSPSYISPVVLWMCHEECPDSGLIIEAAGGFVSRYQMHRSNGAVPVSQPDNKLTVESVRDKWAPITDMSAFSSPESVEEAVGFIMEKLEEAKEQSIATRDEKQTTSKINVPLALSYKFPRETFTYTSRDAILYALSVGFSVSDEASMKYLYEGRDDFTVLPLFGVVLCLQAAGHFFAGNVPGIDVDLTRLFHGEQYFEVHKPLPTSGNLEAQVKLVDILDKGSGALHVLNLECYNQDGEKVLTSQTTIFCVGQGNFGGKRTSEHCISDAKMPDRKPDFVATKKTGHDQAALYRLSGDLNPMHIDPDFAAMAGFEAPILHGLCTYGIVMNQVAQRYAGGDVSKIKAMKSRFAKPVLPGLTLQTEMWKDGNRVCFQSSTAENNTLVLKDGFVVLSESLSSTQPQLPESPVSSTLPGLQSDMLFTQMKQQLTNNPQLAQGTQAVILFNITRGGKLAAQWTADLRDGHTTVYAASPSEVKPDVTLSVDDADLVAIASGELSPNKAFGQGKLKVKGKMALMLKLQGLLKQRAKL